MKISVMITMFAFVATLALSIPVFAHHGGSEYDMQHETTVTGGTVTNFAYLNPHVEISWETKDDKGVVQKWTAKTTNPNTLYRAGWNKETLKPGTQLQSVTGNRCKDGSNCMRLRKIMLANGRELPVPQ